MSQDISPLSVLRKVNTDKPIERTVTSVLATLVECPDPMHEPPTANALAAGQHYIHRCPSCGASEMVSAGPVHAPIVGIS